MRYFALIMLLVMIGLLVLALSRSVLFSFSTGPMSFDDDYIILSPFRDRGPENGAESFFELLKDSNKCQKKIGLIMDSKVTDLICDKEVKSPLTSWELKGREDEGTVSKLIYRFTARGISGRPRLFIQLERNGQEWKVAKYERGY